MSVNIPPNPDVSTFNNLYWISADDALSQAEADLRYLKFPVAQGTENLSSINVNGIATFNNTALPTSLGTLPAPNTISTQIPTMDWVQQAITTGGSTILSNNNTFSGTNDFTNVLTSTGSVPAPTTSDTQVATTAFVQSAIIASQQQNNTYAGLQEALIYSELPYNYSSIASISGTTLYTYGVSSVAFAVSKSFNTTGYSTLDGIYFDFDPTNPIPLFASSTLLSFSPPPLSSFEPCVLAFSADGQYAIATSDSFGTNASEIYLMNKSVGSVTLTAVSGLLVYGADACLSAEGQYQLVAERSGSAKMILSSDYGATFSNAGSVGTFFSCAMSATGKYQIAISQFDGIHNSSDFGETWNITIHNNSFKLSAMSANGQYQIALCNDGGNPDSAFMSYDYGVHWDNIDSEVGGTQRWANVAITDCGRVIIAYISTASASYSLDYGKTWSSASPPTSIDGYSKPTFSVNGKYLIGQKSGSVPIFIPFQSNF
jgi:hypothetical protein